LRAFRFAFGTAQGRRSTVWKLLTHKDEVYVVSRMMGASTKVSVHASGAVHWSLNSPWYAQHRPNQPNQARHLVRWEWQRPAGVVASHVFRICLPETELRTVAQPENLDNVHWITPPEVGQKGFVECYIAPVRAADVPHHHPGFLAALERTDASSLVALVSYFPLDPTDPGTLLQGKAVATRALARRVRPEYRGVALFDLPNDSEQEGRDRREVLCEVDKTVTAGLPTLASAWEFKMRFSSGMCSRAAWLVVGLGTLCCARGATQAGGYIVLGPGATQWGLRSGDTLTEVERKTLASGIKQSADSQARVFRFEPICTRFFRSDTLVVVLLVLHCGHGVVVDDGQGMAVYGASGRLVGKPNSWLKDEYVALQPPRRDRGR
jgi:hypothetical protein